MAQSESGLAYGMGFLAAFLSGLLAVYLVLSAIKKGKFEFFAYYCFVVGVAAIVFFLFYS